MSSETNTPEGDVGPKGSVGITPGISVLTTAHAVRNHVLRSLSSVERSPGDHQQSQHCTHCCVALGKFLNVSEVHCHPLQMGTLRNCGEKSPSPPSASR